MMDLLIVLGDGNAYSTYLSKYFAWVIMMGLTGHNINGKTVINTNKQGFGTAKTRSETLSFTKMQHFICKKPKQSILRGGGFALAELMISAAIIALLAVAVSLAISQGYKRNSQNRQSVSQLRLQNYCFQRLQDEISMAVYVYNYGENHIAFAVPDAGAGFENISFFWDVDDNTLYHKRETDDWTAIASDNIVQ